MSARDSMSVLQLLFVSVVFSASGYPLALVTLRRRSAAEHLLIALPLGLALTTLVLQLPAKMGVPLIGPSRAWAAIALFSGVVAWMNGRRREGFRIHRGDLLPLGAILALVIALGTLPIFSRGGRFYGRAFGDQLNYALIGNYVLHGGPRPSDISRPDLEVVRRAGFMNDRPGDGVVLAFVTAITFSDDISATFFPSVALSIPCWFAGTYVLLRRWSKSEALATGVSILVALAPPLHAVYLESYMAQALASGMFLTIIVLAAEAVETPGVPQVTALGFALGFVFAAYFEFYTLAVLAVAACAAGRIVKVDTFEPPRITALAAAIGLSVIVNLPGAQLAGRIWQLSNAESAFQQLRDLFPWAFHLEGVSRLALGDLAGLLPPAANLAVATLVGLLTVSCLAGLWRATRDDRAVEAVSLLAVLLLPLGIALIGRRPYQFYKLLLSFWPLCLLGLPALQRTEPRITFRLARRWGSALLGIVFAVSTSRMLWVERGFGIGSPRSGMNGYLAENSFDAVGRLLAPIATKPLYVVYPSPLGFRDSVANGWFLLFASRWTNDISNEFRNVGDRSVSTKRRPGQPFTLKTAGLIPPPARLLTPSSDAYVVQIGTGFLEPGPELFRLVAEQGRMRLYRQTSRDWTLAHFAVQPAYRDFLSLEDGVTATTNDNLRIDFQSAIERPDGLTLVVRLTDTGNLHLYSDFPFGIVVPVTSPATPIEIPTGPIRQGMTQVMLRAIAPGDDPAHPSRNYSLHITHIQYRVRGRP